LVRQASAKAATWAGGCQSALTTVGGHPKPATDGRLKTGHQK